MNEAKIEEIAAEFAIDGAYVRAEELAGGHINFTYKVTFSSSDGKESHYVIQQINATVFHDPACVLDNVFQVTEHIWKKCQRYAVGEPEGQLRLIPTKKGSPGVTDDEEGVWRCFNYISGCSTLEAVQSPEQAFQAGRAFGKFQEMLSDFNSKSLGEPIRHFHDTPWRYRQLEKALSLDPCDRAAKVGSEINFIGNYSASLGVISEPLSRGELPKRVTHNDAKINNVLLDATTHQAVCVIDLDTVMPGSVLYDFGDLVRTTVSPTSEDELELDQIIVRNNYFKALVDGYLQQTINFLVPAELDKLVISGKIVTLEVAIRFLTDYLMGDTYFRTTRATQNLERCRAQLALVKQIDRSMEQLETIVMNAVNEARRDS